MSDTNNNNNSQNTENINENNSVNDNTEFEKLNRNRLKGSIEDEEEENVANNDNPDEQEQETDDKLNAQDMQQIAKSGASLAKNAATGNVIGAAKDAVNLAKNKKVRNKIIRHTILQIAGPFLIILLLAAAIFGIFGAVADTVGDVLGGIGQAIVDFFTVDESDGAIIVSDEQIDTIINAIEEQGISTEDLKLLGDYEENATEAEKQRAVRKYIRKFYEAQALTETLNYYHRDSTDDVTYGAIYVYRANGDVTEDISNRQALTYISYDRMQEMVSNNNRDAAKYFSIDDSDNLVIASVSETIVETGTSEAGLAQQSHTYTVVTRTINYKSIVSQYTTKMNFLIDLTLISQNPEFVSAVVDLIKNSRIEITIMDTTTTNVNTVTNSYTLNVHVEADRGATPGTSGSYYNVDEAYDRTEVTRTTTITRSPAVKVNRVKTWFCEQTIEYTKKTDGPNQITNNTTTAPNGTPPEGDGSWKTNQTTTIVETSTTESYEESVRGDVSFDVLGQQGDGERYANGEIDEPTFVGLMETKFRIPYSTREEAAGSNLVSGAEMLFYLLQKDADLENMETIMRYALYLYSGRDFGVTELDGSIFDIQDFVSLNSSGSSDDLLLEYIGYWESGPNGPPTNADGTKYIIIDDGVGNLAVGHGVDIYNSGYLNRFIEAGYTIAEGAEVPVEFVDAIKLEILQSNKNTVNALGLDLTGYQFNALVSFCYNCGSVGGFKTAYNAYWNQERDDKFEEKDSNADLTHQLYTQYFSQYVHANGQVLAGLQRRRRSEWTLFQTGYYDVLNKWHPDSGDLTGDSQIEDGYFAYPCPGHTWTTYSGHEGIDISWPGCEGQPIYAAQAGTVSLVQTGHVNNQGSSGMASYGNCVFIQHENGWQSRYAHMTSVVVSQGQKVEQGQLLGYIGDTGNAYGAHLHISLYDPSGNEGSGSRNWAEIAWPQYRE